VDDSSLEIKYDTVVWTHPSNDVVYYTRSCSYTQIRGSSLSYAFDGVAIWYDYLSYTYQWPTCSVGTMVKLAQIGASSTSRLTVRHRSD